jgi:hypothetical protein
MPKMGRYCKAYHVSRFREFSQWTENLDNLKKTEQKADGNPDEVSRQLSDTDILYLHENFLVTEGVFLDENIIFDKVSLEWIDFCTTTLGFQLPEDLKNSNEVTSVNQNVESHNIGSSA